MKGYKWYRDDSVWGGIGLALTLLWVVLKP